ncbi:MAG: protoporphyrinogen oxidase [Pirellulaceae bacterium]|nr:protoporphyrinogen oxidase [Pirellulaceae bacterium]
MKEASLPGEPDAETASGDRIANPKQRRVAIIGAGISGLAAALHLRDRLPEASLTVFEAASRPGGVLHTVRQDGFLIETSADSFITTMPWALRLCQRLGLEDRLLQTDAAHRRAFVVRRGRLLPIPDGLMIMAPSRLGPLVTTPILSPWGKLRMAAELFVPRGSGRDESLASFARRRFGREGYERLIQPLVGGMYTGDPEQLSIQATMPRFLDMEQTHGSLIRAMRRKPRSEGGKQNGNPSDRTSGSGARYGLFVGLPDGMSELIAAMVRALPAGSIQCGAAVQSLTRTPAGDWQLVIAGQPAPLSYDAVVVATSIGQSRSLLAGVDPELSVLLDEIPTSSSAVVSLGYRREQIQHRLDGFGFVVPRIEPLPILSGSFSSVKFTGRAPDGQVLIRVFLGGAVRPELLDRDDPQLIQVAHESLAGLLGIRQQPIVSLVSRWNQVMPQYLVGHTERIARIRERVANWPGLALAGNAFEGIGVPQCIHSGQQAAERLAEELA